MGSRSQVQKAGFHLGNEGCIWGQDIIRDSTGGHRSPGERFPCPGSVCPDAAGSAVWWEGEPF